MSFNYHYNDHCYHLGLEAADYASRGYDISYSKIAFDMDGVMQLPAILDTKKNRDFYRRSSEGEVFQGSVEQNILFYPGMRAYFLGLSKSGLDPKIVTSMSLRRMMDVLNCSPELRMALFGSWQRVDAQRVVTSPRVFVAHDLVRGMEILLDIHQGVRSADDYPEDWLPFIAQGIRALFERPGEILKLPIVVSLSKSVPERGHYIPLYRLLIDDTEPVIAGVLKYSEASVVQPSTPWMISAPFHADPMDALRRNNHYFVQELNSALKKLFGSTGRHSHVDISELSCSSDMKVIRHQESCIAVVKGHFEPLRKFRQRIAA